MFRWLHLTSNYPVFFKIGEVIYYSLILIATGMVLSLLAKRLGFLGYDRKKILYLVLFTVFVLCPASYVGSRGAGMFYKPLDTWSISHLFETILSAKSHTFHGGMVALALILSIFLMVMRYPFFEVSDTLFLYFPLGHAIGRVGCLIVGCCWGRYLYITIFGYRFGFPNPIPLYEIFLNLFIFYLLRSIYNAIYSHPETRKIYSGTIVASYFTTYGLGRIFLEIFRTERRIFLHLTQAQITMSVLIMIGLAIFLFSVWKKAARKRPDNAASMAVTEIRKRLLFSGYTFVYFLVVFAVYYMIKQARLFHFPFEKAESAGAVYQSLLTYLPVMVIPFLTLVFLKKSGLPTLETFRWKIFSHTFSFGLAISLLYTLYLLLWPESLSLKLSFFPPIILLSILNAFVEEVIYRLGFFSLLNHAGYTPFSALIFQAFFYSVIHFLALGAIMGLLSFLYGIILGVVMRSNKSLTPCLLCHFLIDIGCIGRPFF